MAGPTDTAFQAWDRKWMTEEGRAGWTRPEQDVIDIVPLLRLRSVNTVLDLGCGVGRHSLLLASEGFAVCSLDASAAGLEIARSNARDAKLPIDFCCSKMTDLPYSADNFGYVLAWNVIYHGDPFIVERSLKEISRVLRRGGIFQGTMLSKRNVLYGNGRLIAKDTFIIDDDDEKSHSHYYCDYSELLELWAGFRVFCVSHKEHDKPGSYHWHFRAEKL
ncbi:MAG: class I SAM-dependent methyltransferase [Nitrospirae bacterium]|nr:class I SAM-dependent methyltransferase [Nitrospirota bacterium]